MGAPIGISEFDDSFDDDLSLRRAEEQRLGEGILDAQIRDLEPKPAITTAYSASIGMAIDHMIAHRTGAVLVISRDGRAVGIFTERDVLGRVVAPGVDLDRPVSEVMTPGPETLCLDDGIAFALNRMISRGYRHVPIVDRDERPVAMLSLREVVGYIVALLPGRFHNLPPEPRLGIPRHPDGA